MKRFLVLLLAVALSLAVSAEAQKRGGGGSRSRQSSSHSGHTSVKGYKTKKGTYVAPHHRSKPNKTDKDNWSSKGNVNPDTGKRGVKKPKK